MTKKRNYMDILNDILNCNDCKKYTPQMFIVDNEEWISVVGEKGRGLYLCEKCYDTRRKNRKIPLGPRKQIQHDLKMVNK